MEDQVKLSEVATRFELREDLISKLLREWSEKQGNKVMHQNTGTGEIYLQRAMFIELERAEEMFSSFVCEPEWLLSNKMAPGIGYNQSYVYFLLEDDYVVYVGQSVSLEKRLIQHRRDKMFNSVAISQVHKSFLDIAEQANIIHYNPKLNGTMWNQKSVFKRLLELCDM